MNWYEGITGIIAFHQSGTRFPPANNTSKINYRTSRFDAGNNGNLEIIICLCHRGNTASLQHGVWKMLSDLKHAITPVTPHTSCRSSERSFGLSLMNSRHGWTAITGIIASLNRPEMHLVAESISAPQHAIPGTRTGASDKTSYQTVGGNSSSSSSSPATLRLLSDWDREKSGLVLKRLKLNIKMAYMFSAMFRSFLGGVRYAKIRLNSHSFWQLVSAVKLEVIWHRWPGNTIFIPPCFSSIGATLKQALSIHRKEHISLFPLMWVAREKSRHLSLSTFIPHCPILFVI